jgi:hypothetical protein
MLVAVVEAVKELLVLLALVAVLLEQFLRLPHRLLAQILVVVLVAQEAGVPVLAAPA